MALILLITVAVLAGIDVVMREVFKRDKPLDNGSGAVSLCVFHSNVNPGECGALTVTPTRDYWPQMCILQDP
ncbi:hypothetical protein DWX34_11665 [Ruminococcus sp. AF19-15]|nr:hypothetical protein DWX34_11665 [Ruminococcus sp. AF19-15]